MRVLTAAGAELASLELAASRTFGTAPYVMTPIVAPLVLADPPSACGALHAAPGAVLVAARGDCLFTEKASAAQRAGAVALLVMNTETGRLAMGGSGAIGIPVFALSKADAAVLRRLMEGAGGAVSAQLPLAPDASASAHSISKLAAFSSRGPAADGRVKPDILAPGFPVISARSDGNLSTRQCGVSQVRRRPRTADLPPAPHSAWHPGCTGRVPKGVRRPWHAARRGASHGGLRDSRLCAADRLGGLTACLGFRMHVRAGGRVQGEGSFALSIKQGTSMAAPLVAGIAALVRQYFVEGWCASLPPPCDRGRAPPCSQDPVTPPGPCFIHRRGRLFHA